MSPTKNTPYKRFQCRYFDRQRGVPLNPSCSLGEKCRFVHPSDPNWPGVECYSYTFRKQPTWTTKNSDTRRETDSRSSGHSSSPGRGAPLVSQTDLFRGRCKVEAEDDIPLNNRDSEHNRRQNSVDRENFNSAVLDIAPLPTQQVNTSTRPSDTVFAEAEIKARSERLTSMFKDVAMVSSRIIQDTVLYDQEERKLQTFNEISATLTKISPASAASVSGPIAEIMLHHAQSKERLDESYSLLGAAWEKVFDGLIAEFSSNLENRLQVALSCLQNEAETAMDGIRVRSSQLKPRMSMSPERVSDGKRPRGDVDYTPGTAKQEQHGYGSGDRDPKRRKVADSRSPDPQQGGSGVGITNSVVKISLDDILNQMKIKIDQQSASLQTLTQENAELKSKLQSPPPGPKRSEASSSKSSSYYNNIGSDRDRRYVSDYSHRHRDNSRSRNR
ncbi:hypothetical protein BDP27DRAFT_1325147 [Rhodocollybia butyracea]|uniref:C3H1-type domain-containing protein n=1 Tax=Rhodocollybia butyracea TaxID=206335 RepID=A0A9P5PUJ2_9AGAR|nr:hypothetical protein BDP27DRAFT_1325147 [Rhodocollybia butyracea]